MSIFVILWLLVCMETPGSSAVTRVFVQKGKDLHLNITEAFILEEGDSVRWNNKEGVALVRFFTDGDRIVSDNYRGRITFTGKNYSVTLKNLREADSGVYTANVFGTTKKLAEYNVTVLSSSAVTRVFVQKGKDLHLNVAKAVVLGKGDSVRWNNKHSLALVRFFTDVRKVSDNYSGRITFTGKNYSMTLKNLQEADSGVYTAEFTGELKRKLAEYNVTVQDPVSPVKLRVDSRSVSTCPDSCNLTVTCSAEDSHINRTFRLQNQTFSQEGGEPSQVTPSGASLSVYLENGLIICNHSNQVSWTKANETIEQLCPRQDGSAGISVCLVKTVVLSVGLVVMVTAVISVHLMEKLKKQD